MVVEIAAPFAVRDASVIWPIRRNLLVNCSGALALLATVVIAGLGFRSYARGRRLELQVEIARQVQSELLPSPSEAFGPVRLATVYRPAEQVSGDFYDVFRAGDGRIAIVMGDVSGKGVPAALVMGVIHGAVRSAPGRSRLRARAGVRPAEPPAVREGLPRPLRQHVLGYYDPLDAALRYVNAGHLPPILLRERDHGRDRAPRRRGAGPRHPARRALPAGPVRVRPGDALVLYSDGLVEATSPAGEEYGETRLRELLKTARRRQPGRHPRRHPGVGGRVPGPRRRPGTT